jgi:diacylglycerol kinase (ATP)
MYLFLVNPYAGRGKAKRIWKQVESELQQHQIAYHVRFTTKTMEAMSFSKQAKQQQWTAVVAIGGDGTVHEVANGLAGGSIPLGYIPAGTGNDFARQCQIPFDPIQAWERIRRHHVQTIDILREREKIMLCYISAGFDGYVSKRVNDSRWKTLFGNASYPIGALLCLRKFRPFQLHIQLDGVAHTFADVWLVTVCNGKSFGGGMQIAPHADATDGVFDLCIVYQLSKSEFLRTFPSVYQGKHVGHRAVKFLRGNHVQIQTNPAMWAFADGEEIGQHPLDVQLVKQGLMLL